MYEANRDASAIGNVVTANPVLKLYPDLRYR
jgi:hypothetical protein